MKQLIYLEKVGDIAFEPLEIEFYKNNKVNTMIKNFLLHLLHLGNTLMILVDFRNNLPEYQVPFYIMFFLF